MTKKYSSVHTVGKIIYCFEVVGCPDGPFSRKLARRAINKLSPEGEALLAAVHG